MIKINLLPARKPKRQTDPALRPLIVGIGALAVAAVAVILLVDLPRRGELDRLAAENADIEKEIKANGVRLKGYPELLAAEADAVKRADAITHLAQAKVVPANVLQELGDILTEHRGPTMTVEMTKKTGGIVGESDPNKRFAQDWDPTHVWLTSFVDKGGEFKLEGGAQTQDDVNELSKRLAASVYFQDVAPAGGQRMTDGASGTQYFKFTLNGKVAY